MVGFSLERHGWAAGGGGWGSWGQGPTVPVQASASQCRRLNHSGPRVDASVFGTFTNLLTPTCSSRLAFPRTNSAIQRLQSSSTISLPDIDLPDNPLIIYVPCAAPALAPLFRILSFICHLEFPLPFLRHAFSLPICHR